MDTHFISQRSSHVICVSIFDCNLIFNRGMIMPDDQSITLRNIIGMGVVLAVNFGVAALLAFFQASVAEVCMACVVLLLLSILTITRYISIFPEIIINLCSSLRLILLLQRLVLLSSSYPDLAV